MVRHLQLILVVKPWFTQQRKIDLEPTCHIWYHNRKVFVNSGKIEEVPLTKAAVILFHDCCYDVVEGQFLDPIILIAGRPQLLTRVENCVKKTLTFDPGYNMIGSQFVFGFVRVQYGILVSCSRDYDVVAFDLMTRRHGNSCCWEG